MFITGPAIAGPVLRLGRCLGIGLRALDAIDALPGSNETLRLALVKAADIDGGDPIAHASHISFRNHGSQLRRSQVVDSHIQRRKGITGQIDLRKRSSAARGVDERGKHSSVKCGAFLISDELRLEGDLERRMPIAELHDFHTYVSIERDLDIEEATNDLVLGVHVGEANKVRCKAGKWMSSVAGMRYS